MRALWILVVGVLLSIVACGPRTHRMPEGPPPEYEPPTQWTDAGTPAPPTSASAAPRS